MEELWRSIGYFQLWRRTFQPCASGGGVKKAGDRRQRRFAGGHLESEDRQYTRIPQIPDQQMYQA